MQNYKKGPVIGEGTYGSVLLCEHKETGRQVAIKKVRMCGNQKEGINKSVLRELKALQTLRSSHIVDLLDVFTTKNNLVLVFEYMDWNLEDVVRDKNVQIPPAAVKAYMQMLLQALAFTHEQQVVHRDIKPDNLLIGSSGFMKLADFGLARSLTASPDSSNCMTPQVFSRWYRPPELLMGCNWYGTAVDLWAAGCVLAELLLRRPWFPGHCDMDQLDRIFKALGVPTVESWPGLAQLPHRIDFKPAPGLPLKQVFPAASPDCLDLLQQLMQFDPDRRLTAAAALQHPYFSNSPAPTSPAQLPKPQVSRGSRHAASIPLFMHDIFMQPAMLMRQQPGSQGPPATAAAGGEGGGVGGAIGEMDGFFLHRAASTNVKGGVLSAAGGTGPSQGIAAELSRPLFALMGQQSFSRRLQHGQGLQGLPHQRLSSDIEGLRGYGCDTMQQQQQQQQQQHTQSCGMAVQGDDSIHQHSSSSHQACHAAQQGHEQHHQQVDVQPGASHEVQLQALLERRGSGLEDGPWKGRLSFGSIAEEAAGDGMAALSETTTTTSAGTCTYPSHRQQQGVLRPSPALQATSQAGGANTSQHSMRPPLHRSTGFSPMMGCVSKAPTGNPSAIAAAAGAEGGAGAASVAGPGCGLARRRVSDLAAALSAANATAAAAAAVPSEAGSVVINLLLQQQQQQATSLLGPCDGLVPMQESTPAAAATRGEGYGMAGGGKSAATAAAVAEAANGCGAAAAAPAASESEGDGACPMSLGTSAHKRSRAVFEAPPNEQRQQQQQHKDSSSVGTSRRVRRSSVGTAGCCSMDTDVHSTQPSTVGKDSSSRSGGLPVLTEPAEGLLVMQHPHLESPLMPARPLGQLRQEMLQARALESGPAAAAGGCSEQAERPCVPDGVAADTAVVAGARPEGTRGLHVHFDLRHASVLAAAEGMAAAAVANSAAGTHAAPKVPSVGAIPSRNRLGPCSCADLDSAGGASCCPMSLDQQGKVTVAPGTLSLPPSGTGMMQSAGFGSQDEHPHHHHAHTSGARSAAAMGLDPADLAELAYWWRPRLDSAERRYLRTRKLQMDEALLQASQPDVEDSGGDCHQHRTPDSSCNRGMLFASPTPAKCPEKQQQQQQQQQELPPSVAAVTIPAEADDLSGDCGNGGGLTDLEAAAPAAVLVGGGGHATCQFGPPTGPAPVRHP